MTKAPFMPQHHTTVVNGVSLHYVTAGQGDLVVLLHGWPQTWYAWRKVIPELAKKFTVLAPDMRGMGDSERPKSGYNKKTVAEDIHQLVQHLGFSRINLVAHDMGVPVAYPYAAMYPDEVRSLVMLDVSPPKEALSMIPVGLWHIGFHLQPELPELLLQGHEREYLTLFYRRDAAHPEAIAEEAITEYVRCYSQTGALSASLAYYRAFPQDIQDNAELAKTSLKMPVLVLMGEQSPMGNSAEQGMRALAQNMQVNVIEDCGHWIAEEKPEELLRELLAFLS